MASQGEWGARVERLAGEWRRPPMVIAAALADVAAPVGLSPSEAILFEQARPLATSFARWRHNYLGDERVDHNYRLRQLFRAIHCDAPDYEHILMQLVALHARLFSPAADEALAYEVLNVYRPVAKMLGIYHFRRAWTEESVRLLYPQLYAREAEKLDIPLPGSTSAWPTSAWPTSEGLIEAVEARQRAWRDQHHGGELPSASEQSPRFDERLRLFNRLRDDLLVKLEVEFDQATKPLISLIPLLPGMRVYTKQREPNVEQPQLNVRLFCQNQSDCYRALGVIHNVTQLIGPGQTSSFRDYIALPQPNGFSALQTVCYWPPESYGNIGRRLIKFNIVTREMHDLNDWGILSDAGRRRSASAKQNARLRQHFHREEDLLTFLGDHNLDTESDPVYCFTPLGEIVLLEWDSKPLDFAYQIHTQMAGQAARIDVNGEKARLDAPLKNGDLVQVTLDPLASPLDFSWQSLAKGARARSIIRKVLRRRARNIHPGRARFEDQLIRLLDVYRQDYSRGRKPQPYEPRTPTTAEIERFLARATLGQRLVDRPALYAKMAEDLRLAQELAYQLISQIIFPTLKITMAQQQLHELGRIDLCPACRPTPVDSLRYATRRGRDYDSQIIHTDTCRYAPTSTAAFDPRLIRGSLPDRWPMFRFDIQTIDSARVLAQLLDKVYELPLTYLFHVEARATNDGLAVIELDVGMMQPQLCRDLENLIRSTSENVRVSHSPLPGGARRILDAVDMAREIRIPFTESEVTDSRFVNREDILSAICHWLEAPSSSLLLLHGQRRVGKSSLARRLLEPGQLECLTRPVLPVYIDFRAPSVYRPNAVALHIAWEVCLAVGLPPPRFDDPEVDPFVWLNGFLGDAAKRVAGDGRGRLLLIIDEFDAELEEAVLRHSQPRVLTSLRAIQRARQDIYWLLVVQDIFLANPKYQAVLSDIPIEVPRLAVRHLSGSFARLLIERPLAERDFTYAPPAPDDDDIPAQIVDWTGGNPYLIQIIGRKLMERAMRARRKEITQADLNIIINQVLSREGTFNHFTEYLMPPADDHWARRLIAAYVAYAVKPGRPLACPNLVTALVDERRLLSREELTRHVHFLEQVGIFEIYHAHADESVSIPIRLLHKWIRNYWDFEQLIAGDGS